MEKKFLSLSALASLLAFPFCSAIAVPVQFSGGGFSQLTITLPQAIEYNIIAGQASGSFFFRFSGINTSATGNPFQPGGTITFSIDSGAPQPMLALDNNDLVADLPVGGVSAGQTIVLSAGSLTTLLPVFGSPVSGDYGTFILGAGGVTLSEPGTVVASVPDPRSTLWLAVPVAIMLAFSHRRELRLAKG